ncbi:hypothetical protein BH23ACT7_BH23ACT7_15770 [soil metagenome]
MSALYIVKSPAASLKRDGVRALVLALHDVVAVLHEATPPAGRFRWSSGVSAAPTRRPRLCFEASWSLGNAPVGRALSPHP